jgi:glycosyltransferase involved in cell wall biosynthesis
MRQPELTVVVPSHNRPLRLRWLLNALADQTLDPELWEVAVGHDSSDGETDLLLESHPLSRAGRLLSARLPAGTGTAGTHRNLALTLARAPTVVFTDDDCRPPEHWLENVLAAVRDHPGEIVQGPISPDPDELTMLRAPLAHTQSFADVPRVWAECCNIVYPRDVLEALGGFRSGVLSGEDTDLAQRALAAGITFSGDQRMGTFHAVEEGSVRRAIRGAARWEDVAWLIRDHPQLRSELFLGLFWKRAHASLLLAVCGAIGLRRNVALGLLALPWIVERNAHGPGMRGRLRQLTSLPAWALLDGAEIWYLARGSRRHRALVL